MKNNLASFPVSEIEVENEKKKCKKAQFLLKNF
jgi:hypothetical protein